MRYHVLWLFSTDSFALAAWLYLLAALFAAIYVRAFVDDFRRPIYWKVALWSEIAIIILFGMFALSSFVMFVVPAFGART